MCPEEKEVTQKRDQGGKEEFVIQGGLSTDI
jgi:hypothetical protein